MEDKKLKYVGVGVMVLGLVLIIANKVYQANSTPEIVKTDLDIQVEQRMKVLSSEEYKKAALKSHNEKVLKRMKEKGIEPPKKDN
jgi:hypothetical protein